MSSSPSFLERSAAPALAYRFQKGAGDRPLVLFCGGFRSDMDGTKATYLARWCAENERPFLRFDYRGHGTSQGRFEDGTIGLWRQDALDIMAFSQAPRIVIVGSSMGGWIGLLCALACPDQVAAFVGLAAAPDFTRDIREQMDEDARRHLETHDFFYLPAGEGREPYKITRNFLEDGERWCLLSQKNDLDIPLRLIQGKKDTDVPWKTASRITQSFSSQDQKIFWREDGDHGLSTPDDLSLLSEVIKEVSG